MTTFSMGEAMAALGGRMAGLNGTQLSLSLAENCWPQFKARSEGAIQELNREVATVEQRLQQALSSLSVLESRARAALQSTPSPDIQSVFGRIVNAKSTLTSASADVESLMSRALTYAQSTMQQNQCPFVPPHTEATAYREWINEAKSISKNAVSRAAVSSLDAELGTAMRKAQQEITAAQEAAQAHAAALATAAAGETAATQAQAQAQVAAIEAEAQAAAQAAAAQAELRRLEIEAQVAAEERQASSQAALRELEIQRAQYQMQLEQQRQQYELERMEREEERASRQEELMTMLKLLETGVVKPSQVDVSQIVPGLLPAAEVATTAYTTPEGLPALPAGYMYAEVPDTAAAQAAAAMPAYPYGTAQYPAGYPGYGYQQYYQPGAQEFAWAPAMQQQAAAVAPSPYLGPTMQAQVPTTPPPVQAPVAPVSAAPVGFPGFEFSSGFTPGTELFGMGQSYGYVPANSVNPSLPAAAKVAAGYQIMGPISTGSFDVTSPEGKEFRMSAAQALTAGGGPVIDKYTGRSFYLPAPSDEVTAVDVAAGFKAFADAMLPAAAGAMQLYQMSKGGGGLTAQQMLMLQQQEQQRKTSGWLLAGGALLLAGGVAYLALREEDEEPRRQMNRR